MNIPQSFLENWMQENACLARFNLGSSVVSSYSLGELRPHGGVSCFLKLHGMIETELFCTTLIQEQEVLLVPGNCFGYHDYVKLGFGCNPQELQERLQLVSQHLQWHDSGLKQVA